MTRRKKKPVVSLDLLLSRVRLPELEQPYEREHAPKVVRLGNQDRGMAWKPGEARGVHDYLRKPLKSPIRGGRT